MSINKPDYQIQALEDCLKQIERGISVEEVLQQYPEMANELRPLLETARQAILTANSIVVPEGAQAQSRAAFLSTAQELQQTKSMLNLGSFLSGILLPRLTQAALVLVVILVFGAMTAIGVSASSLPGDALYSLKLATERTRLLLTNDTQRRLELQKSFDQERLEEVQDLASQARTIDVEFAGTLQPKGPEGWQLGGIPLVIDTQTEGEAQLASGVYVQVTGKVLSNGKVQVTQVRARTIEFTGVIQSISQAEWVIEGMTIRLVADTIIEGTPALGSKAEVKALLMADGDLQGRQIKIEEEKSGSSKSQEEETKTSTATNSIKEPGTSTSTPTSTATQKPSETPRASKTPKPSKTAEPTEEPEITETPDHHETEKTDEPEETEEPHNSEPSETNRP